MAILEKLGDFAKNVSDLAEDSLEMSRLNSQINSFKSDIEKSRSELADFYLNKFVTGELFLFARTFFIPSLPVSPPILLL